MNILYLLEKKENNTTFGGNSWSIHVPFFNHCGTTISDQNVIILSPRPSYI